MIIINTSDKNYNKYIKGRLGAFRFLVGFGVLTIIIGIAITADSDWVIGLFSIVIGILITGIGITLIRRTKNMSIQVTVYTPKQGFSFYRKTAEDRRKSYNRTKHIFCGLLLVPIFFMLIEKEWVTAFGYFIICLSVWCAFTIRRNRIKYHEQLDDVSYFELEELGLISENEIVVSLYKDFSSWEDVKVCCPHFLVQF